MKLNAAFAMTLFTTAAMSASNAPPPRMDYHVVPLVSDQDGMAPNTDPNLVNPWGIAEAPGNPLWVSDNGTSLSTLYDPKSGAINPLVVKISADAPTGAAFVPPGTGFPISDGGKKDDSIFVFDTESGAILGWSNNVDVNKAVVAVDNSAKGSAYKGLAFDPKDVLLFAADFVNNEVQVYDRKWNRVRAFTDPSLPKHFAPFNVTWLNGQLYVAFAERARGSIDEVDGKGLGYVDTFDAQGHLLQHLIANGGLNAPWGMLIGPPKFGKFAGDLLVGNFGDGRIHAYNPKTGEFKGKLTTSGDKTLVIDGLWSLAPGPNDESVIFSAGPDDEKHGLLGQIHH